MTDGRVVFITGGARGIGLACARAFQALGDRVAITYNASKPVDDLFCVKCDVTVNVVAPGAVETDMLNALGDKHVAAMAELVPMKRIGRTEEVAAAVTFLASPEASYITGAILPVDGGMAMGH